MLKCKRPKSYSGMSNKKNLVWILFFITFWLESLPCTWKILRNDELAVSFVFNVPFFFLFMQGLIEKYFEILLIWIWNVCFASLQSFKEWVKCFILFLKLLVCGISSAPEHILQNIQVIAFLRMLFLYILIRMGWDFFYLKPICESFHFTFQCDNGQSNKTHIYTYVYVYKTMYWNFHCVLLEWFCNHFRASRWKSSLRTQTYFFKSVEAWKSKYII